MRLCGIWNGRVNAPQKSGGVGVEDELDEVIREILWRRNDLCAWWIDVMTDEEEEEAYEDD